MIKFLIAIIMTSLLFANDLDSNRFVRNIDGVILDRCTGAHWIVNQKQEINFNDAIKWVQSLNKTRFAGRLWRLGTLSELDELYMRNHRKGSNINYLFGETHRVWAYEDGSSTHGRMKCFFPANDTWNRRDLHKEMRVFAIAHKKSYIKELDSYRFVRNANGVILDSYTESLWVVNQKKEINFNDAIKWVQSLNKTRFAGRLWRLGTLSELDELYMRNHRKGSNINYLFGETHRVWAYEDGSSTHGRMKCFFPANDTWNRRDLHKEMRVFAIAHKK